MKKIAIVHHDDNDGYFSAAIVAGAVDFDEVKYYPVNYKNNDWFDEILEVWFDHLYMLDFTAKPEQMDSIINIYEGKFTHIDHHPRAERYKKCVWDDRKSATLLTFEYFYPEKIPGNCVELIDIYDLWKKEKYWESALRFNLGFSLYMHDMSDSEHFVYDHKKSRSLYNRIAEKGGALYLDRKQYFDNKKVEPVSGDIANYLFEWWYEKIAVI